MPDGVTLPSVNVLTSPSGTDFTSEPGNATNASMARFTLETREAGLLPRGYPWIPALLVGCGMVVFLSLSFYSHHKRVRRKRELLMDYLSVLLYSGAGSRGRSVSILCNTNSLALSQLGKSFRITGDKKEKSASPTFLTKRYLNDLAELSSSNKKSKNVLKRFISSPTDCKFQHLAGHLINLNKSTRVGRGGLGSLARTLSVPEDFDPCDTDFWSLSEASTNIAQGVMMDHTHAQRDEADGTKSLKRCDTNPESMSEHSYENIAFSDHTDFSSESTMTTQSGICLNGNSYCDLSVNNPKKCKGSSLKTPSLRTLWFLNKPCMPAAHLSTNNRQWIGKWHANSVSEHPTDKCLSVMQDSVLPPCVHSLGKSYHSSGQTQISGDRHVLQNNSFLAECERNHLCYEESHLSSQYPEMCFSATRGGGKNKNYLPGKIQEIDRHDAYEQASTVGRDAGNSLEIPPLQENVSASFDPLSGHGSSICSWDNSVELNKVHSKGLDQMSRLHSCQCFDAHSSRILDYCSSLEDSAVGSQGRFPVINHMDYNPHFPGETHPTMNTQHSSSFLSAAFSQLHADSHDMTQADPLLPSTAPHIHRTDSALNPIVPSRSANLTLSKMVQSKLHTKIPNSFRHSKTRRRGFLNRAMSTQSAKTLISRTLSPSPSFSDVSSELLPASRPHRFPSFHENPGMTITSPGAQDSGVGVSGEPAAQFLCLEEPVGEHPSCQMCRDAICSGHPSAALQTMVPTRWKVSGAPKRADDAHRGQLDTLISLDSLSSSADSWSSVQPASHVHRLPRFQVRSGMSKHPKLLACHSIAQARAPRFTNGEILRMRPVKVATFRLQGKYVDSTGQMDHTDVHRDNQDSLWTSGPHDTQM